MLIGIINIQINTFYINIINIKKNKQNKIYIGFVIGLLFFPA